MKKKITKKKVVKAKSKAKPKKKIVSNRKTVAVVMIVKNEEAMLGRCLESVKDADAIYIADTGSQDRTIEIAKKYTDNILLGYIWDDNFSSAQNYAKGFVKEDWILSIDADEFCHDFSEVRKAIELATSDMVRVKMIAEGGHKLDFGFGRLFKNSPNIFWVQRAHKHLSIPGEGEEVGNVKITFGRSPAHNLDPDRTLRILELSVAEEGDAAGRNLYYLGREYWYKAFGERREEYLKKCTATLGRYVQISIWPSEKAEAFLVMSQAYSALSLDEDARDACLQCLKINPEFREAIEWMAGIVKPEHSMQWKRMAKTANNNDVMWDRVEKEALHDVIFIAPHNDDEALFGAYTLMRVKPLVIVVTESWIQYLRGDTLCGADNRRQETIEAMKIAGCPVLFMGIKDTELTEENFRERLKVFNPEKIYIPAVHEGGNDQHNLIGKVALELFGHNKCERYCTYVKGNFEIVKGGWEVRPVHDEAELKNKMLDCYKSQLALPSTAPHFKAVRNQSEWLM